MNFLKILSWLSILTLIALIGCSDLIPSSVCQSQEPFSISNIDDYNQLLRNLNDINTDIASESVSTSRNNTRGFRDIINFFKIVEADLKGAYIGAKYGFAVLNYVGAAIGVVLCATLFSAAAATMYHAPSFNECNPLSNDMIQHVYLSAKSDITIADYESNNTPNVAISFPKEYTDLETAAISHNLCLSLLSEGTRFENLNRFNTNSDEYTIINSNDVKFIFDAVLTNQDIVLNNDFSDKEIYAQSITSDEMSNSILLSFMAGFESTEGDMELIKEISNKYIKEINATKTLNSQQKYSLISAFIVCAYSANYWISDFN